MIVGSLIGAGVAVYFTSRFISSSIQKRKERKHKFYEGIDNIFDTNLEEADDDSRIDKETEEGIIGELFSRTN